MQFIKMIHIEIDQRLQNSIQPSGDTHRDVMHYKYSNDLSGDHRGGVRCQQAIHLGVTHFDEAYIQILD